MIGIACLGTITTPAWGLALAAIGIGGAYGFTGMMWRHGGD